MGSTQLAEGLLQRLQFPLTLGSYKTSLDVGRVYMSRLLASRMMKGAPGEAIDEVARKLTEGYTDHGFCILVDELKEMGLKADELKGEQLDLVWDLHLLELKRRSIQREMKQREIDERLRNLPPGLIQDSPDADENRPQRNGR
jgi:hypothetical protein